MGKFSELSIVLQEVAEETGYSYESLVERVENCVKKYGMKYQEAIEYVCELALEGEI